MDYVVICLTALVISIVTLFSGFGLGTVLMPVFAIFFPLPIAIASTAVVHLATNIFKAAIVGKLAKWNVVLKFAIPAAATSALGAYLLGTVSHWPPLTEFSVFKMTVVGLIVGLITVAASLLELVPKFSKISFSPKYIPLGGLLSGFFGGISGNQGMLRSAFLIKAGLNKEQFIGTSVISSIVVDMVRLSIYGWEFTLPSNMYGIIIAATLTAFLGSYIGAKLIHKITFKTIQILVGIMLLVLGFAIALGLI